MLSVSIRSFPRSRNVWFAERATAPSPLQRLAASQFSFTQVKEKPLAGLAGRATVSPFRTLLSDLSSHEDLLWAQIHKRTREYIKSAAADPTYEIQWFAADPDFRFYDLIAAFCAHKDLWVPSRNYYRRYIDNGTISCGFVDGALAIVHVHLLDPEIGRVRLLWSARALGRADVSARNSARLNKLLHWEDLRHFRNVLKLKIYDWGGVALTDEALTGVDRFKQSFGGTLVTEWNVTWRSPAYVRLARVLRSLLPQGASER
jgi:hypothetical protein